MGVGVGVCVYVHAWVGGCGYVGGCTCMRVGVGVGVGVHVYVHACVWVCGCVHVCVGVRVCVVCVCVVAEWVLTVYLQL